MIMMINKWKRILDMMHWIIMRVPIRDDQVTYPDDLDLKEFVGIHIDKTMSGRDYGVIYHSRPLTEEDIVHELLHAKNPDWSESEVVVETERLLKNVK